MGDAGQILACRY